MTHRRDAESAEVFLLLANRERTIGQIKLRPPARNCLEEAEGLFVCRYLPTNKKIIFLCVLCDSAVKYSNLALWNKPSDYLRFSAVVS